MAAITVAVQAAQAWVGQAWAVPAKARAGGEHKHFQAKHVPAKAGMGTGSREENATRIKR
jgi:hypothetical protein